MNKWNRLLAALDHVYGFNDKKKSTIRKVSQIFDERTNEHVIMLEYRVRRGGDGVVTRSPRKKDPVTKLKLLSKLAARAREGDTDSPNRNIPPISPQGQQLIDRS